jgi:PBSX family phage portal protein
VSSDDRSGVRVFGPNGFEETDALDKLAGVSEQSGDTEKASSSQQADVDEHEGTEYYEPPYPPDQLARLLEQSETHAACVTAKARNVAGYGLEAVPYEGVGAESPPGEETIRKFWFGLETTFQLGPDKQPATASEVLEHAWEDLESVGYLTLELLVNSSTGEPTGLAHIPAHTIRKRKGARGYVQLDDADLPAAYFGEAGDRYDSDAGEQWFVNAEKGVVGETTGEVGGPDAVANELIVLRNYSALAPHYGTPDIIPGLQTLAGDVAARTWNTKLFDNDTVPRMAVVVENGELTDRAWTELEEKFQKISLDENKHRGILIEAQSAVQSVGESENVSIRLEPLTVGVQEDADFLDYREENEHDISKAHSVPPVIINRTSDINYANAREQRQEFAQSVIKPKQERFSERLYQIIHVLGFGIDGWAVEFTLHGGENRQRNAEISQTRIEASMGAMTINETREELGLEPLADADGEELPQGRMLLSTLQQSGGGGQPSTEDVASAIERAHSSRRAQEHGYSITRRKALDLTKAQYSEGDIVEYDSEGHIGVIVAVKRESFTVPTGEEGEEEVDASSDSPVYVVARQTGGFGVFSGSELSAGSIPESEQGDPSEITDDVEAQKAGWSRLPEGWSRLTLLDAWASMGGQFDCGGGCCMGELHSERLCASMKDEVLGTTRWRGRF